MAGESLTDTDKVQLAKLLWQLSQTLGELQAVITEDMKPKLQLISEEHPQLSARRPW